MQRQKKARKNKKYIQKQDCSSVAVIFVGIGKYIDYFPDYYKSCQELFLTQRMKDSSSTISLNEGNRSSIVYCEKSSSKYLDLFCAL